MHSTGPDCRLPACSRVPFSGQADTTKCRSSLLMHYPHVHITHLWLQTPTAAHAAHQLPVQQRPWQGLWNPPAALQVH